MENNKNLTIYKLKKFNIMLIQKMNCPYGCKNAVFGESTKMINENSNLLLEGNLDKSIMVKVYTCKCCGNTFETKMPHAGKYVI
jgi:transcription elongation factor Elf1